MILITKILRVLILALALQGCATTVFKSNGIHEQPVAIKAYTNAYTEYKSRFLKDKSFNYAIDIFFYHLEKKVIGRCHLYVKPFTRKVLIDYTYWKNATDDERLSLIFHELGHCDLNYSHQEDYLGIMNSKLTIKDLSDKMIEDFFLKGY